MKQARESSGENYVVLHDIRSTQNVGAILRTCDAAGINKIFFSGITPSPIDRFGRKRSDVAKSALGAEDTLDWEVLEDGGQNILDFIKKMKNEGFQIVALEQSEKSVDYKNLNKEFPSEHRVIILGNEVKGVDQKILDLCDVTAEIPMLGEKESLNVSVALGIFLFRILEI